MITDNSILQDRLECEILYLDQYNVREQIEYIKGLIRRYRLLEGEIKDLTSQLQTAKHIEMELATDTRVRIDGMPKKKGGHTDPTATIVESMVDIQQKKAAVLQRRIRDMVAEQALVVELMEVLTPREREIIRWRYIRGKSWINIALESFLCERQCQRISEKGFKKMALRMQEIRNLSTPEAKMTSAV